MWTRFSDSHSGGYQKLSWKTIYIEAPQEEAELIFFNRFGENPRDTDCACCGPNYSINEADSFEALTASRRNCRYDVDSRQYVEESGNFGTYFTVDAYRKLPDVFILPASDIQPEERSGVLPAPYYPLDDSYDEDEEDSMEDERV